MANSGSPAPVGEMDEDGSGWTKTIWIPRIDQADIELMPDEEGLTKSLAIKKRAIDAGQQDLPAIKDQVLDRTQIDICKNVFDGILLLNQFLAEQLGKAVQAAAERTPSFDGPERLQSRIDAAVDGVVEDERRNLVDLREDQLQCRRDMRAFAARNDLLRPAVIKDDLIVPIATMVALFVGETLVNGFVLGEVSAQGVLGGAIIAMAISAVNIALGFTGGIIGWRNAFHVHTWRRVVGWSLAILLLIAAVAFNLLVAHFREAAELLASGDAADITMAQLNEDTVRHVANAGLFGLSSPMAWGLFVLGMAVNVMAAHKGYEGFTDPYWGYQPLAKRARDSAETYGEAFEDLRAKVREGIETIERQADQAAERAASALQAIKDLKNLALQRRQEVLDSEDIWVVAGNGLLKMYRDENQRVRGKGPAYFGRYFSAEDYRTGDFGAGLRRSSKVEAQDNLVDRHVAALDVLIEAAAAKAEKAAEAAREAHRVATERMRGLDAKLTLEDDAIEAAALRRLDDDKAPEAVA